MTREVLHLPEPARTLLNTAFETLDDALVEIVPDGQRWRLGGGTTDIRRHLPGNIVVQHAHLHVGTDGR